jgi:hypothetical protein
MHGISMRVHARKSWASFVEVAKALSVSKHEVIHASRNGEVKVNLEDTASIRAMFDKIQDVDAVISCAGNAAFRPFADLTDAEYELTAFGAS